MENLLYYIAVVLVVIWLIAYLGYHITGGLIHILLVIAAVAIILRIIRGQRPI